MDETVVSVTDVRSLQDVRGAFLAAVDLGERSFTVELPSGALHDAGSIELVQPAAGELPPIDVCLRAADGPCVLVGSPLAIATRGRIAIESVALVGGAVPAISLVAGGDVALRDVSVLGVDVSDVGLAPVAITAAGVGGTALLAERTVIARCRARAATLAVTIRSGAWLDELRLVDVVAQASADDQPVLSVEAARAVHMRGCRLRAGEHGDLLDLGWPPLEAELAACGLDAPADALLWIRNDAATSTGPVRLTDGTRIAGDPAALPAQLVADPTVARADPAELAAQLDAIVETTARRLATLDARVGDLLR